MNSHARAVSAMIVSAGPTVLPDMNELASVTKRFGTSHDRLTEFSTDVRGSDPMRAPPASWMAEPIVMLRRTPTGRRGG